jgi:hypothetical protein
MHWPNLLARDPDRNNEVVVRWSALLNPLDFHFDRLLGANTAMAFSQLVHHRWIDLATTGSTVHLDWTRVAPHKAPGVLTTFFLKIQAPGQPRYIPENLRLLAFSEEFTGQWRLHLERVPHLTHGRILID